MAAQLERRNEFGVFLNDLGLLGVGVEVGAYRGEFSRQVLSRWHGREWHLVDPWQLDEEFVALHGAAEWNMDAAREDVVQLTSIDSRAKAHRIRSTEWRYEEQLDAVYLDAAHGYEQVTSDLHHWWPRVKPGGLLAGHDYLDEWRWGGDINRGVLFGVRSAVDRFAESQGRVVATTNEEFPTWWFRKPLGSMAPSDVVVLSMNTRDVPWASIVSENHEKYCQKWGYHYQREVPNTDVRPASWHKVSMMREALETFEFVMWIDGDAIFQRFDIGLNRFWDGVTPFFSFKDQINGLNAGVFMLRRCEETIHFVDKWNSMTDFNHHHWLENGAIMELERRGELIGVVLPHRLANSYPHFPGCWAPSDFVAHVTGLVPKVRLAFLRDLIARVNDSITAGQEPLAAAVPT